MLRRLRQHAGQQALGIGERTVADRARGAMHARDRIVGQPGHARLGRGRDPAHVRLHRYEALLADPEAGIRALLGDCGLAFDPACLAFHQSRRSVRTASAAQVRQPLRTDTARAGRYGALLDPLRAALGG